MARWHSSSPQASVMLAAWPRKCLSHDTGLPPSQPGPTEITLGPNVSSREEVDSVMEQARNAGARITEEGHDTFWGGYAGYFQDPDGGLWEIV